MHEYKADSCTNNSQRNLCKDDFLVIMSHCMFSTKERFEQIQKHSAVSGSFKYYL